MGEVYRARDTRLDRTVAIKVAREKFSERFRHEARAIARINHPNICTLYDVGPNYLIMEFVDGGTLRHRLAEGPCPEGEALDVAIQVAKGLKEAHQEGITHRDIKPSNLMVSRQGPVKIMDFGLAKLSRAAPSSEDETETLAMTAAGAVMGSPAYMSPEQVHGDVVDSRTDIWSLGVVLYEMLSGQLPFHGAHSTAMMRSILLDDPAPTTRLREGLKPELDQVIAKALAKDPAHRYQTAAEFLEDLECLRRGAGPHHSDEFRKLRRRVSRRTVTAIAAVLLVLAGAAWLGNRQWRGWSARNRDLPQMERLLGENRIPEAFRLARQAAPYVSTDRQYQRLWKEVAVPMTITTTPEGALVEVQPYSEPNGEWLRLGVTPVTNVIVPRTYLRWRVTKQGFAVMLGSRPAGGRPLSLNLEPEGDITPGMVRIPGGAFTVNVGQVGQLPNVSLESYLLDKFEITNRQYAEFIAAGGYMKREFWKQRFTRENRELAWEEAMAQFRDATGRPGPSSWEGGRFPGGQAEHPVTGVSWFEAAAYAEYSNKSLPSIFHWFRAADLGMGPYLLPASNFTRKGSAPVGRFQGIGPYGNYDMAGNAKEWCWTATSDGLRFILGGGWNEPSYQFNDADARSPWDRAPLNGFRLMKHLKPPKAEALAPQARVFRDYAREKPISDEAFAVVPSLYAYEQTPLNPRVEEEDASHEAWTKQKVTVDAAYGGERLPVYLFLPKGAKPPFQVVVYCPGASALRSNSSKVLIHFPDTVDFILHSGRALVYPVYFGMYERRRPYSGVTISNVLRRELFGNSTKDLGRAIDYLETRKDFNVKKLAYMGTSYGASNGIIWSTLEQRIKTCVYQDGGFFFADRTPDVDPFHFAPRQKKPTLMLNGRYDFTFPLETSQKHLFRLLGTPAADKRHVVFDTSHDVSVMRAQFVREVLNWLDKYLGRVE
jgi:formylglycine-generating enzyme required for sulfatase activity/dienelactone hydrolase